jgi:UDP-N-acetylmuramoyl-L-alanyl-D-glutamate--2,6-diaminopimelate ligase
VTREPILLSDLLSVIPHSSLLGPASVRITDVTCDSRAVRPGCLFAALKGFKQDGRAFASEAFSKGAAAVLSHGEPREPLPKGTAWIISPRDREAFSAAAAAIFRTQDSPVKVVGVTGTNGKTTVAYLLRSILRQAGGAGMLGTVEYDDGHGLRPATRTTPEADEVHRWIRTLADAGLPYGAMEVSSHSLALARVRDVRFAVAAFTNLTRDHLDFHRTMEAYYLAKKQLFDLLTPDGRAVLNLEDSYGVRLAGELDRKRQITVGLGKPADVRPKKVAMDLSGIRGTFHTPAGPLAVESRLTGQFNLLNLLVACGAALGAGAERAHVEAGVPLLEGVPGRLERVEAGQPFRVFVDYAHTDDALKNLLQTVRDLKPARIITVFGCGGDKDRTKRPLMGAVAARLSDVVILTSDNPRSEDPAAIARDAESGLRPELTPAKTYLCVLNREEALREALSLAREGDAVVVAGKGHEREQILGQERREFHDPTVLRGLLKEMGWG